MLVNRSRRPGFDARSVRVILMEDRVALRRDFSPSTSMFPFLYLSTKSSVLLFAYTLLLPEGQTDEAWRTSKNQCCYGSRRALDSNRFHLVWRLERRSFRPSYIDVLQEVIYDLRHQWVYWGSVQRRYSLVWPDGRGPNPAGITSRKFMR